MQWGRHKLHKTSTRQKPARSLQTIHKLRFFGNRAHSSRRETSSTLRQKSDQETFVRPQFEKKIKILQLFPSKTLFLSWSWISTGATWFRFGAHSGKKDKPTFMTMTCKTTESTLNSCCNNTMLEVTVVINARQVATGQLLIQHTTWTSDMEWRMHRQWIGIATTETKSNWGNGKTFPQSIWTLCSRWQHGWFANPVRPSPKFCWNVGHKSFCWIAWVGSLEREISSVSNHVTSWCMVSRTNRREVEITDIVKERTAFRR